MRTIAVLLLLGIVVPWVALAQPVPPKLVNIGPVYVDFGTVNVGSAVTVPVSVRNLTTSALSVAGGGVGGGVGFTAVASTCGALIAAGGTCALTYEFRPLASDGTLVEDATGLSFSDGVRGQGVSLAFAGRGNGTLLHFAPRVIDFGDVLLGDIATVRVNILNLGSRNVSLSGGGFPTANGFYGNSGCSAPLAPGASCFLAYSFAPLQLGQVENTAWVGATSAVPQASQPYSIDVRGRGIGSVPVVAIYPIAFDFGDVTIGDQYPVEVKYTNLGGSPISYAGGAILEPFEGLPATGAGCSGSSTIGGATCTFIYWFRPLVTGVATGTTSLTFSRPGATQDVTLDMSGTGVGQFGRVSPLTMDFGSVRLGTTISAPVTITNTTRLPISGFLGGVVPAPFSWSDNCPTSLPVGQSCQYTFTFTANSASVGPQTAVTSLSFTNLDNVRPVYTITLRASGDDLVFAHSFE